MSSQQHSTCQNSATMLTPHTLNELSSYNNLLLSLQSADTSMSEESNNMNSPKSSIQHQYYPCQNLSALLPLSAKGQIVSYDPFGASENCATTPLSQPTSGQISRCHPSESSIQSAANITPSGTNYRSISPKSSTKFKQSKAKKDFRIAAAIPLDHQSPQQQTFCHQEQTIGLSHPKASSQLCNFDLPGRSNQCISSRRIEAPEGNNSYLNKDQDFPSLTSTGCVGQPPLESVKRWQTLVTSRDLESSMPFLHETDCAGGDSTCGLKVLVKCKLLGLPGHLKKGTTSQQQEITPCWLWKENLESTDYLDNSELSFDSDLDLEEHDCSFPYPDNPGHQGPMSDKRNRLSWDLAYALLYRLAKAGKYDDIDLKLYSEKRIFGTLANHVKHISRCQITGAIMPKGPETRGGDMLPDAYLMSHPNLISLINVVEKCTSDDESDISDKCDGNKCTVALNMPWHNPCIEQMMIKIDRQIEMSNKSDPKKSNSSRRHVRYSKTSFVECPKGMPNDCYNGKWISKQQPSYVSNLEIQPEPSLKPRLRLLESLA
ncbi:hypothetical protein BY996DRAFT_6568251 [Phakopsora pachyrhizi]|nr:hypothetical protein BY996DRAFT_6568251 [Phakopsora pachyrhizi]